MKWMVFPLLYIGGQGKEFYIDNDTRYHITNEWTFVGVTYDNIEGYYKSNGEAIPDLDDTATYVALRFYGQNEMWGKRRGRRDLSGLLH